MIGYIGIVDYVFGWYVLVVIGLCGCVFFAAAFKHYRDSAVMIVEIAMGISCWLLVYLLLKFSILLG
ncbi:hypothetical protein ACFL4H_00135 [Candidatus Neomarinimicrobiota bacterium]